MIATRVQVVRQSGAPGKRRGSCFESIGRIAHRQVYYVVPLNTDRKRDVGRTGGLSVVGEELLSTWYRTHHLDMGYQLRVNTNRV